MRRCATNMLGLGEQLVARGGWEVIPLDEVLALPVHRQWAAVQALDLIAINTDGRLLMLMAALVRASGGRGRLVGIDTLLPRPVGLSGLVRQIVARRLLHRVDRFYLYQRDVRALDHFYGIGERCEYVPFKSNAWDRIERGMVPASDGGYVLHAGRTHRDLDCLLAACRGHPVPVRLLLQNRAIVEQHGTRGSLSDVPPWVEVITDADGREEFEAQLAAARLVVITVHPDVITPAGCSTMLDAMALGKCTIISEGPATRGILDPEVAVIVPAGDPAALGQSIVHYYHDDEARRRIGYSARAFAKQFAGSDRLHADLAKRIAGLFVPLGP